MTDIRREVEGVEAVGRGLEELLDFIFSHADTNNDGEIEFDEFEEVFHLASGTLGWDKTATLNALQACFDAPQIVEEKKIVEKKDKTKQGDLQQAILRSDMKAVRTALVEGIDDINVQVQAGETFLMIAAKVGHGGITRLLAQFRANLNTRD